jgi:hypothetical protein
MPMRGELSFPAIRTVWPVRAAEPNWPRAFGILKNPDFAVIVMISGLGLLASIWLTMSFPLPVDVASFLAQAS